jgi:Ricin-type beta-trefoil lectin domain-like
MHPGQSPRHRAGPARPEPERSAPVPGGDDPRGGRRPRGRSGGVRDRVRLAAARAGATLGGHAGRIWRRLWGAWQDLDQRLRFDTVRRERSAAVAVGAVVGVALLAIVVMLVVAGTGRPSRGPARGITVEGKGSPTPSKRVAESRPTPTATPSPTLPAGGSLRVAHSGLCLGVPGGTRADGTQLVQRSCDAGPAEGFHLVPVPDRADTYLLVDSLTGRCLDVEGASVGDGARIIQWECHGQANQQFTVQPAAGLAGHLQLVAVHSGKCVDVAGPSTAEGAPVHQWTCHAAELGAALRNQAWRLRA